MYLIKKYVVGLLAILALCFTIYFLLTPDVVSPRKDTHICRSDTLEAPKVVALNDRKIPSLQYGQMMLWYDEYPNLRSMVDRFLKDSVISFYEWEHVYNAYHRELYEEMRHHLIESKKGKL